MNACAEERSPTDVRWNERAGPTPRGCFDGSAPGTTIERGRAMAKKKSPGDATGDAAPPLEPLRHGAPPTEKAQPVHTIRLRNVRAAIWQNARADGTSWYTVTYSRS